MTTWSSTYLGRIAIAFDMLGAAVFFNRDDCTVSSLCRMVQLADAEGGEWLWRTEHLAKLKPWQVQVLRRLGRALDEIQPNHCEGARLGDLLRAGSAIKLLEEPMASSPGAPAHAE